MFHSQNIYILTITLAGKLDCVKTTYQSWENGRREPPINIIRKLFILGAAPRINNFLIILIGGSLLPFSQLW
ncbi:hypothetical protein R83H12_02908 [Fibrobacteria bacterium R8-3-H12]